MSNTNRGDRNDLLLFTTDSLAGQVLYQTTNWPISQLPCWQADQRITNNITSTVPPFSDYSLLIVPISPRTDLLVFLLGRIGGRSPIAPVCPYIVVLRRIYVTSCIFMSYVET